MNGNFKLMIPEKPKTTMADIRRPAKKRAVPAPANYFGQANTAPISARRKISVNKQWFILPTLALIFIFAIVSFSGLKQTFARSTGNIYREISAVKISSANLEISQAIQPLETINAEIKKMIHQTNYYGLRPLAYLGGIIIPSLGKLPQAMEDASSLSDFSVSLAKNISYLETNALDLIASQRGEKLIFTLNNIKRDADNAEKLALRLSSMARIFGKNYNAANPVLTYLKNFLNGLISLLEQPKDQHILLILQNPSEMRPAGGFIGSFGDLTLNRGSLKDIYIDDIYNADRQLKAKLIPPKELQGITARWGARDANWFFDFPTSAKKVISLLEQSDLYQSKSAQFEGAAAINTNVLETIFEIIGPIKLEKYGLEINSNNFLEEIQREVEAGRDKKPGQNPKRVLSALAPLLMEKLQALDAGQKKSLMEKIKAHLANKDIIFYFKDWKIQNFFEKTGVAGDIIRLPKDFSGDYLAVVNANVGGGKSDAFIKQKITLESSIESNGLVTNELSVTKTHGGQDEKDWWYRLPNKTYMKILAPENSRIISVKGNDGAAIAKKTAYSREYEYDADLAAIEKGADLLAIFKTWLGSEFGKKYFGTWFTTPAGKTKTISMQYESGVKLNIRDNMRYEFIFEKQSGVDGILEYSIAAPPGYYWKESDGEIFQYNAENPKAREKIELTLIKIQ